ncbi:hypothetical protein RJT34_23855 [Clitoria ternatea]|uniref:Non-specific serine/threonine protein kinase n=1 Tax=Clitoria ternatea TaxID=43366 RepID=A0AAN9FLV9_CLITE
MHLPWLPKYQLAATIFIITTLTKASCFYFNFSSFQPQDEAQLLMSKNSKIYLNAIQVTPDIRGPIHDYSGRVFYNKPYKLWSKKKNQIAAFNTTFVLNISPQTSPGGEGLAFILTSDTTLPENSSGEWLGILNATSNGTSQAGILAVEFDTRKSFTEDGPDNHVGININSINSIIQIPLINTGINISSGTIDVTIKIHYADDSISVFGSMNGTSEESMETLLVSPSLNVSSFLQQEVYLGFSASTSNYTELNCVKAWEFNGVDIGDDDKSLLVVYVTVPMVIVIIIIGLVIFFLLWQRKNYLEKPEDAYPRIEDQIQCSSMAPKKFKLKEIRKATGGFSPQNKLGEGTPGYMAPETFLIGRATVESDVYAFGVLVLEVVCGRRPGNVHAQDDYKNSIVYWVWELYGKGKIVSAVDERLRKEGVIKEEEVEGVLVLGLGCCHPNPHKRPSMRSVLQVLNGEAPPPEVPMERPAFTWPAMPPSFKEDHEDYSLIQGSLTQLTDLTGR